MSALPSRPPRSLFARVPTLWTLTRSTVFAILLTTVICGLSIDLARHHGFFQSIELEFYDWMLSHTVYDNQQPTPVVLVRVYENDLQRFRYPVPDGILAEALRRLDSMSVSTVGLDIFRDMPTDGYRELRKVLQDHPNFVLINKQLGDGISPPAYLLNPEQIGFADLKQDIDGRIRRGILILWNPQTPEQSYFSLPLQLALKHLSTSSVRMVADPEDPNLVRLGNTTLPRFRSNHGGYRNADDGGYQYLMDYRAGTRSFSSYSLSDLIDQKIPAYAIAGKVVLIGSTSESIQDRYETPFSKRSSRPMYGIEIQAHATDQLIRVARGQAAPLRVVSDHTESVFILVCALLGSVLGCRSRPGLSLLLTGFCAVLVPLGLYYGLFVSHLWIPVTPAITAVILSFGIGISWNLLKNISERRLMSKLFGTYVPAPVADALWDQREIFRRGDLPESDNMIATVIITDLRGYMSALECIDSDQVMEWLNSYMRAMTDTVERFGGYVEDYAGDGLKANFGVPVCRHSMDEIQKDACSAVDCALAMTAELVKLNELWMRAGMPTERIRIGICTGQVIAGSIGGSERMAYTTVGSTVNIAARLESFDKQSFDCDSESASRILISESTWQCLHRQYATQCLGTHLLKGKLEPVTIYRVVSSTLQTQS